MASTVDLFEELKPKIGAKAAQMLAESIPVASELATKADIRELRSDIGRLERRLEAKIDASATSTMRWMLMFFIPLWIGTWGAMLALIFKR